MSTEAPGHQLFALLRGLDGDIERSVPVVRVELEDGRTLDVFRAQQVRERPIAWRVRGFIGTDPPREFVALVLGTLDGRATLTIAGADAANDANAGGSAVSTATPANRPLGELADLIARRVRERFGDA